MSSPIIWHSHGDFHDSIGVTCSMLLWPDLPITRKHHDDIDKGD